MPAAALSPNAHHFLKAEGGDEAYDWVRLDILPDGLTGLYEAVSVIALTMVAFLLGGSLTRRTILTHGTAIMALSGSVVIWTVIAVSGGLWLMGLDLAAALLLGGIATATDPAATEDALRQVGAKGAFADRLRGIVAIDDVVVLLSRELENVSDVLSVQSNRR